MRADITTVIKKDITMARQTVKRPVTMRDIRRDSRMPTNHMHPVRRQGSRKATQTGITRDGITAGKTAGRKDGGRVVISAGASAVPSYRAAPRQNIRQDLQNHGCRKHQHLPHHSNNDHEIITL
jgi:hypothetical protein